MSLKVWNDPSDPYDSAQQADNLLKIDQHNHADGQGVPIGSDGIQDGAILARHIYPGTITPDTLDPALRLPIGTVLDWYSETPAAWSTILGDTWAVCDGSTLAATDHAIPGVTGPFTLPNLINTFTLGADPNTAVNSAGSPLVAPGVGGQGGSHIRSLNHTHTVNAHGHGMTHTHTMASHTHGIGAESPGTNATGDHAHGTITGTASRGNSNLATGGPYAENIAFQNHTHTISTDGNHSHIVNSHSHGGGTGGPSNNTTDGSSKAITDNATPGTDAQLSTAQDFRPAYVGLVKIMKVK